MNPVKCKGPAQCLAILGHWYDAILQRVNLPEDKQRKYLAALRAVLSAPRVTSKQLESLLGYLGQASQTEPYGRPFLSAIAVKVNHYTPSILIRLDHFEVLALRIWELILSRNRGLSYKFVLNELPFAPEEIFVDAAKSYGIGGFYGDTYFQFNNQELDTFQQIQQRCGRRNTKNSTPCSMPIAYLELLAAMIGIICFSPRCAGQIVRLNCDNSDAVAQLQKSRCFSDIGFRILSVIELYKHRYRLKVSTHYIKGVGNTSADLLSRGKTPRWLKIYGSKCTLDLHDVADLLVNPIDAWQDVLLS